MFPAGQANISDDVFSYINLRGSHNVKLSDAAKERCIAKCLPEALKENELSFGDIDKIFAAQWLDDTHIIVGTKCNKLVVQNIMTRKIFDIPLLLGSANVVQPTKNCGIHSISINQSNTKLITGGENPNAVAVYKLPSLEPLHIGEFHSDWLFTTTWLTDSIVASGSRDKRIAFWYVDEYMETDSLGVSYSSIQPIQVINGERNLDKVRAIVYNTFNEHLATVTSNGYIHLFDVNNCSQVTCNVLPFLKENVCIAQEKNSLVYAVGSLSHVTLLDTRNVKPVGSLASSDQGAGVRSISFKDCVITIGTGYGSLLFYDVRMNRLLHDANNNIIQKKCGKGWLRKDAVYEEFFWDTESYPNAVYAHAYHPTSLKLLTAGGPLALGLYGNYAAYWD